MRLLSIVFVAAVAIGCESRPPEPPQTAAIKAEQFRPLVHGELPSELERFRAAIEKSRLDYIKISAKRQQGTEPWVSKFRGKPYLPKGSSYPRDVNGTPLVLLAQLNFGEMPELDGYPSSGLLQYFVSGEESREHVWGSAQYHERPFNPDRYFRSLQDQRFFRVIYHPRVVMDRNQMDEPPVVPSSWVLPIMEEAVLTFEKHAEYVLIDDYRFQSIFGKEPYAFFSQFGAREESVANGYIAFSREWSLAKIGGYASFVQNDPRSIKPTEDWLLLLEIQSSGANDGVEILWGDVGVGGLFIRRSDLQKLDFSKVVYYWDPH